MSSSKSSLDSPKCLLNLNSSLNTGHEGMINDAKMDYYGLRLATASSDQTVRIFSVDNKTGAYHKLAHLTGFKGPVWQLSWSHPNFGSLLASASYDGRIIIWKEMENSNSKSLWRVEFEEAHDTSVNAVAWSPPEFGAILAAGISDGNISILKLQEGNWETTTISKAHELGYQGVSWSPVDMRIASCGNDFNVKVWMFDKDGQWTKEALLQGHSDWVTNVEWRPLAQASNTLVSAARDGRILVWTKTETPKEPEFNHSSSTISINMDNNNSEPDWTCKVVHIFERGSSSHVSWDPMGLYLCGIGNENNKMYIWKQCAEGSWKCVTSQKQPV